MLSRTGGEEEIEPSFESSFGGGGGDGGEETLAEGINISLCVVVEKVIVLCSVERQSEW